MKIIARWSRTALLLVAADGCAAPPAGLAKTRDGDGPRVVFDFDRRPLPEIPLPNDIATRPDPTSPTRKRINASLVAPTELEATARLRIDELSGWGAYQHIAVSFDAPLDLGVIFERHRDYRRGDGRDYDFGNDAVYVVDVTPESPTYLEPVPLDFGEGNFPALLRTPNQYWEHDPKTITKSLALESHDEDYNGNGRLDPGEDLDLDGVLDRANLHPEQDGDGASLDPARDLMSFYELETNTLIFKPILPLRERTTYAVVLTNRLRGKDGDPVRSPFDWVNHTNQTDDLAPAIEALAEFGLGVEDIAFAWSFTTQDATTDMVDLRDGMYGAGDLAWLAADNPPELTHVSQMVDLVDFKGQPLPDPPANPYLLPTERLLPLIEPLANAAFGDLGVMGSQQIESNLSYYAYHVSGRFRSPRLLDLIEAGNLDARSWPANLHDPSLRDRVEYDEIQFWCSIPHEQYRRDPSKPPPVVLYAHGYTSNKLEPMGLALHGKWGIAACGIDAVAHGVDVGEVINDVRFLLALHHLAALEEALLTGRLYDIDGDNYVNAGAEALTAYMFRTRDTLRQSLLDWMHFLRLIRNFGTGDMPDLDGDGRPERLGDFDGNGEIDFGGPDNVYFASGTSLGGLLSSQLAGLEPAVIAAAPISGGAGLVDLSVRSEQGGVVEALVLRLLGPSFVGEPAPDGSTRIYQLVVNGNRDQRRTIAFRNEIAPGDVVMVTNLRSGDARCARVMPDDPPPGYADFRGWPAGSNCSANDDATVCRVCPAGTEGTYACDLARTFRVGIPADAGDPVRLDVYAGPDPVEIEGDLRQCTAKSKAVLKTSIEDFEVPVTYGRLEGPPRIVRAHELPVNQNMDRLPSNAVVRTFAVGDPLVALEDGFGFQRGTPSLRKFTNLAQMVVEAADPASWAVHYSREPLEFREGDETFLARPKNVLNVTTIGDPNVPVNTGVAIAKVAGFVELFEPDPRYGKTPNRVLIDEGIQEGIPWLSSRGPQWGPVLVDADVLSGCANGPMEVCAADGLQAPRMMPPLRLIAPTHGSENGKSGIVFPMTDEFDGVHGFPPPGLFTGGPFDVGQFMEHQIGWFFMTLGTEVRYDVCMGAGIAGCDFIPPPPSAPP